MAEHAQAEAEVEGEPSRGARPVDHRVELTVEGPAAFAGALVDALKRHGVAVVSEGDAPLARTLDVDDVVTVPLTVEGSDPAIDRAVSEFVAEYPEAVVREANAGLG